MTSPVSCALLSCSKLRAFLFIRKKIYSVCAGVLHMDRRNEAKPTMELVNIPPIVTTYRQALHTFDPKNKGILAANLNKLKTMMDGLKAADLGFDRLMTEILRDAWKKPNKAPCTYIEVFQNSLINMSIFVLKPGFKMPLHDHPHMHGLLKVIHGGVRIRSFSEHPMDVVMSRTDIEAKAKQEAMRLAKGPHKSRKLFAQITTDRICSPNAETCTLTPTVSNYHEIQALDAPAAFFDILSPPYDTHIEGIGPRRCRYYRVVHEISTNVVQLEETPVPECFYCDQAPYLGPQLA